LILFPQREHQYANNVLTTKCDSLCPVNSLVLHPKAPRKETMSSQITYITFSIKWANVKGSEMQQYGQKQHLLIFRACF
jgi:hypothetical protein